MRSAKSHFGFILAFGLLLAMAKISLASVTVTDLAHNSLTGEFQYTVQLSQTSESIKAGDGFTIYDFPGLITSGPFAPSLTVPGYTYTLNSTDLLFNAVSDPTKSDVTMTNNGLDNAVIADGDSDNPAITNISFVYNGGSPIIGPLNGVLTIYSTTAGPTATVNTAAAAASKDTIISSGLPQHFEGNVSVPVPEPVGVSMLGFLGFGLFSRKLGRRRD